MFYKSQFCPWRNSYTELSLTEVCVCVRNYLSTWKKLQHRKRSEYYFLLFQGDSPIPACSRISFKWINNDSIFFPPPKTRLDKFIWEMVFLFSPSSFSFSPENEFHNHVTCIPSWEKKERNVSMADKTERKRRKNQKGEKSFKLKKKGERKKYLILSLKSQWQPAIRPCWFQGDWRAKSEYGQAGGLKDRLTGWETD